MAPPTVTSMAWTVRVPLVLVVLVLALLSASCQRTSRGSRVQAPTGTAPPPPVTCPLTGEERPPDFEVARPAVAVKIDNAARARPQAGLESADVVYEALAEGGITRFLAVYHCSDAPHVGPVRSARFVDGDILVDYAPVLFGYSGANPVVGQKIQSTKGIIALSQGRNGQAYRRVKGRRAPHDLFTSTDELRNVAEASGPPQSGLVFALAQASGEPLTPITSGPEPGTGTSPAGSSTSPPGAAVSLAFARYNLVRYTYEAASGAYLRFHSDKPHLAENGSQLRAVNVLVIKVDIRPGQIKDVAGNFSPEIGLVGEGETTILSKGLAISGRWIRHSLSERMRFVDEGGETVKLAVGNTWIHLLPGSSEVAVE